MACYKLEPQLYIVKDECLKKASEPKALSKWSIEALKSKHCLSGSMATGFVMGGIGAGITGGDIWQGAAVGCVVALANFSLHKAFSGNKPNDIIVLEDEKGASGNGHQASLIGDDKNGWDYISKDGRADGNMSSGGKSTSSTNHHYNTLKEFLASADVDRYNVGARFKTTHQQDLLAIKASSTESQNNYHLVTSNCADTVLAGLNAAGISVQSGLITHPNYMFNLYRSMPGVTTIDLKTTTK